ncbi:MAG: helix-turn-helix domain-containing protein [Rhodospirillales bacterium]|jgi:DNA-binding HxlR family transcriptional regulator
MPSVAKYKNLPKEEIQALEESRPFQKMLVRISNKWNVLVVRRLSNRRMRPSALRREIGNISPKVLTQTLRELESYGLIEREIFPIVPPKVEYRLTPMGDSLVIALDALRDWAMDNNASVEAAMEAYQQQEDDDKI